ncbi:hypothetical protein ACRQV7_03665 [Caproiciproducens sp. R2]|uniref:hypothetical protein n=1 Tax=Caproiciproducens sp. R2 TaxID=3435187 RepID=UPI0040336B14
MDLEISVSVKGVFNRNGKYLLRKNRREEYELLGGKLERTDQSTVERLIQEYKEESGIGIAVQELRHPWLYKIGMEQTLIVPYVCTAEYIPEVLFDEDGGQLDWIEEADIENLNMPVGYKDTIADRLPQISISNVPKKQKLYHDDRFQVVFIFMKNGRIFLKETLNKDQAPYNLFCQNFTPQEVGRLSPQKAVSFPDKIEIYYEYKEEP